VASSLPEIASSVGREAILVRIEAVLKVGSVRAQPV